MAGKNDYGFNAEEAINSLRPDTPKRQSTEMQGQTESPTHPVREEVKTTVRNTERKNCKSPLEEYQQWLKGKTDFNSRAGKCCNIRKRYHYRIAKLTELLGDKSISISTYIDMVLADHFKRFDSGMDAFMKQKFDEMQMLLNKDED